MTAASSDPGPQSCSSALPSRCIAEAAAKRTAHFPKWKDCVRDRPLLNSRWAVHSETARFFPVGTLQKPASACCGSGGSSGSCQEQTGHRGQSPGKLLSVTFLRKQHNTKPLGLSFTQTSGRKPSCTWCAVPLGFVQVCKGADLAGKLSSGETTSIIERLLPSRDSAPIILSLPL